jgi:hypothetical protein
MTINSAAHKKQYELLPPEKKVRHMVTRTEQHHEHLTEEEKIITAQIRSVAATLYDRVDLDELLNFSVSFFKKGSNIGIGLFLLLFNRSSYGNIK